MESSQKKKHKACEVLRIRKMNLLQNNIGRKDLSRLPTKGGTSHLYA